MVGILGPFLMSGQSCDFHDLTVSAGRIRRGVGCSTANAQVLSNHLQQFFLAEHFAHLITTVLRNTHPFAEL